MSSIRFSALVLAGLFAVASSWALSAASIFGDHMVLQRNQDIRVWGTAEPGARISATLGGQRIDAIAGGNGEWKLTFTPMPAGGPYILNISSGDTRLDFSNVLVGDVWLCSGQSNMVWPMERSEDSDIELLAAEFREIRLIQVPRLSANAPVDAFEAAWTPCTPQSAQDFSAVAYYFGRHLHMATGIPIGLIQSAVGGTPVEAWTSYPALEEVEAAETLLAMWTKAEDPDPDDPDVARELEQHERRVAAAKKNGQDPPSLRLFGRGWRTQDRPANLYNGMIAPLIPYAIAGAIWYQGESNGGRGHQYRALFPAMIQDWRARWDQGEFPFYWVQLANFREAANDPNNKETWPGLREAQSMTLSLPNTGQAVITDIGEADDIHPRNKEDVAERLARWALRDVYGIDSIAVSGPVYESHEVRDNGSVVLKFKHDDGLLDAHNGPLTGFAIAGDDKTFVWAEAEINEAGNAVIVRAEGIEKPVSVRYNWSDNPQGNLFNGAGLPASPFRTDDWTLPSEGAEY